MNIYFIIVSNIVFLLLIFLYCLNKSLNKHRDDMSPEERAELEASVDRQLQAKRKGGSSTTAHTMQCPKCNSNNISVLGENKKSFSAGKAAVGGMLAGPTGTLAGFTGKKNGYDCYCSDCMHKFIVK